MQIKNKDTSFFKIYGLATVDTVDEGGNSKFNGIAAGNTLDLLSLNTFISIAQSTSELKDGIDGGKLVVVVDGAELSKSDSLDYINRLGTNLEGALANLLLFPKCIPSSQFMKPPNISGVVDDWTPTEGSKTLADVVMVKVVPTSNNTLITGITPPSTDKRWLLIIQNGATNNKKILFKNNQSTSTSNNRFLLKSDIRLERYETAIFIYDTDFNKWTCVSKHL